MATTVISKWANTQMIAEVSCPKCNAALGENCKYPSGRRNPEPHWQRSRQYLAKIGKDEFNKRHQVTLINPVKFSG